MGAQPLAAEGKVRGDVIPAQENMLGTCCGELCNKIEVTEQERITRRSKLDGFSFQIKCNILSRRTQATRKSLPSPLLDVLKVRLDSFLTDVL